MEFYEFTIRPTSGFGTPLKGDTLFGQFCWQLVHKPSLLKNRTLPDVIAAYKDRPAAVFSSAFPKLTAKNYHHWALKKPDMPSFALFRDEASDCEERREAIKRRKRKQWMLISSGPELSLLSIENRPEAEFLTGSEIAEKIGAGHSESFTRRFLQPHNTINRQTWTTGTDRFAPFMSQNTFFCPETELALFVLIDSEFLSADQLFEGLERIGKWGYGRDASTGMGRFDVDEPIQLKLPDLSQANALYCLAPCVPEPDSYSEAWFSPFTRFGKHGDAFANQGNPFKTPVIMADEGAVFRFEKNAFPGKPYFGRAVADDPAQGIQLSKQKNIVVQGYSPYLPVKLEGNYAD